MKLNCVFISDTHRKRPYIGSGDILIHSGDEDIIDDDSCHDFFHWLANQDFKYKVFVPGNHDRFIENHMELSKALAVLYDIILLIDESVIIEDLKIWGSPYTPQYGSWAFMKSPIDLKSHWRKIPTDTDILITHGPPQYLLDFVPYSGFLGCQFLTQIVMSCRPLIHAFGHIHEGYGFQIKNDITFINAALQTAYYVDKRNPWTVIIEDKKVLDIFNSNEVSSFEEDAYQD